MSFASVYEQLCDFQTDVVNTAVGATRTLTAPLDYPKAIVPTELPLFINSFGNFQRRFIGDNVYEYPGSMTMTLYTAIAGVGENIISQFDTVNWIDATISQLERYTFLEVNGTGDSSLIKPITIQTVEPLLPNLRYIGNGAQLFWGGRITISVVIAIDKAC